MRLSDAVEMARSNGHKMLPCKYETVPDGTTYCVNCQVTMSPIRVDDDDEGEVLDGASVLNSRCTVFR